MSVPKKSQGLFERHMQTVLTFIITALIAWVGTTSTKQITQIALLQQSMDNMQGQILEFTAIPRFTQKDFEREIIVYKTNIVEVEKKLRRTNGRTDNVLGRIRKLEDLYIVNHERK